MTVATITHPSLNSGTALDLWCSAVVPSIKANNAQVPCDNKSFGLVEVQTKSIENPKIVIQGLQLRTDLSNAFNETHLLQLAQLSYSGANAATLNVTYGKESLNPTVDSSTYTVNNTSYTLAKSITVGNLVNSVTIQLATEVDVRDSDYKIIYEYSDATSSFIEDTYSTIDWISVSYTNPNPSKEVTSIDVYLKSTVSPDDAYVKNITYYESVGIRNLTLLGGTANVKVIFESSTIPIDVTQSVDGYVPIVNMTLVETL